MNIFQISNSRFNILGLFSVFFIFFALSFNNLYAIEKKPTQKKKQIKEKKQMKEIAVIETDKGIIKFEFYEKDAPNTVNNFKKLADKKFYNGLKFHRVVPDFVIQGGCPNGNGTGNPGYKIKAEFNKRQHLDGTVAMARSQEPDSAGCQFYICMGPQPFLDGKYTVFGQVIEGLDVVYQIEIGDVMKKVYIEKQKEVNKTKSETK